jgi:hypothetical protein
LLTQFRVLRHGAEGNIYFEATDPPSVTFLMRQCARSPSIVYWHDRWLLVASG